ESFQLLWAAGAAKLLGGMPGARETVDPGLGRMWDQGDRATAVEFLKAQAVSAALGIRMGQFHEEHNLLITPTMPIVAFEAGHDVPPGGDYETWPQWTQFSYPFNMTQQPAISIPVGTTAAGLPVGLQIVGPRHSDDLVLAAGRFVEWVMGR